MEGEHTKSKPKPSTTTGGHRPTSKSELISSAKVIADAAKSTVSHETDKVDKGKVAGAAADLLGAAKHYGKLEEKSFGKYVDKAEGYLHQYHSSHSSTATATASAAHVGGGGGYGGEGKAHGHSSGGGGYGEYVKLAQGLLKKQDHHGSGGDGEHGHSSSGGGGGGAGDYIKLAQGFLKKH